MADDALGGVGGAAGRKKDGIDATVDYRQSMSDYRLRPLAANPTYND